MEPAAWPGGVIRRPGRKPCHGAHLSGLVRKTLRR